MPGPSSPATASTYRPCTSPRRCRGGRGCRGPARPTTGRSCCSRPARTHRPSRPAGRCSRSTPRGPSGGCPRPGRRTSGRRRWCRSPRVGGLVAPDANGEMPNFTHGLAALIRCCISWISRLMLFRRQSARVGKPRRTGRTSRRRRRPGRPPGTGRSSRRSARRRCRSRDRVHDRVLDQLAGRRDTGVVVELPAVRDDPVRVLPRRVVGSSALMSVPIESRYGLNQACSSRLRLCASATANASGS